jgi:uracil-DNA glycosylase
LSDAAAVKQARADMLADLRRAADWIAG